MADVWLREDLRDSDDLVSVSDFALEIGMDPKSFSNRIRAYADKVPEVVRVVNNKTRYFVRAELKLFVDSITGNPPRTKQELAIAEIAYLKGAIREGEAGLRKHDATVEASRKNVEKAKSGLETNLAARRKAKSLVDRRREELEIAELLLKMSQREY